MLSSTVTLAGVSAEIFSTTVMEVLTGSSSGGFWVRGGWACAATRNGQIIRTQQAGVDPTGVAERAGRWGEDNFKARIIQGRFRYVGALRVHQCKVLENSILCRRPRVGGTQIRWSGSESMRPGRKGARRGTRSSSRRARTTSRDGSAREGAAG